MTRWILLSTIIAMGCGRQASGVQQPASNDADERAVKAVVTGVAHHIDARQWDDLRALYADEVETDYTSLFGGEVQRQPGDALIGAWNQLLTPLVTQHLLGPIDVDVRGDEATARCHVRGYHFASAAPSGPTWMVAGHYIFKLRQVAGSWKISHMTLETFYQTGNQKLLQEAAEASKAAKAGESAGTREEITMKRVEFASEGAKIVGNLYLPPGDGPFPAVVVAGSWTTVKEQMAGTYAEGLAAKGYAALAIDARGYGESAGEPRFYESPERKIADYKNAISFLSGLDIVDSKRLGAVGVCAGAGYIARVSAEDDRVKSMGLVAAWLHDREAVKAVYGGAEGVDKRLAAARAAKKKHSATGEVEYIPAISETDESAAMYGPFAYYLDPQRGAIPEWSKRFAVMSWEDWLTFNPLPAAAKIDVPVLMVHSDEAVLPDYAKRFFNDIPASEKRLHWTEGTQFDFYDQEAQVTEAIAELSQHFGKSL